MKANNISILNTRDASLDIAKGIGIILVVIGHCVDYETILGFFIYGFHMPLFFFVSGVCFNPIKYNKILPFFQSRVKHLLFPAFVFSIFIMLISQCFLETSVSLTSLLWNGFPHAIWFLGVLFVTELMFWYVWYASRGKKLVILGTIVLFFWVGACFSSFGLCGPYSLFTTFTALSFYGTGNLLRLDILRPSNKSLLKIFFAGIFLLTVYFGAICLVGRTIIMSIN